MLRWTRNLFEWGRLRADVQLETGDWWLGVYFKRIDVVRQSKPGFYPCTFQRTDRRWYVCLLPLVPVRVTWKGRERWQKPTDEP